MPKSGKPLRLRSFARLILFFFFILAKKQRRKEIVVVKYIIPLPYAAAHGSGLSSW
jgi:hypothetical protein